MNYDPVSYLMHRESLRTEREHKLDVEILNNRNRIGDHEKRIASIESWRASLTRHLRRWPYLVFPIGLIFLNLAPKETIALVAALVEAAQ